MRARMNGTLASAGRENPTLPVLFASVVANQSMAAIKGKGVPPSANHASAEVSNVATLFSAVGSVLSASWSLFDKTNKMLSGYDPWTMLPPVGGTVVPQETKEPICSAENLFFEHLKAEEIHKANLYLKNMRKQLYNKDLGDRDREQVLKDVNFLLETRDGKSPLTIVKEMLDQLKDDSSQNEKKLLLTQLINDMEADLHQILVIARETLDTALIEKAAIAGAPSKDWLLTFYGSPPDDKYLTPGKVQKVEEIFIQYYPKAWTMTTNLGENVFHMDNKGGLHMTKTGMKFAAPMINGLAHYGFSQHERFMARSPLREFLFWREKHSPETIRYIMEKYLENGAKPVLPLQDGSPPEHGKPQGLGESPFLYAMEQRNLHPDDNKTEVMLDVFKTDFIESCKAGNVLKVEQYLTQQCLDGTGKARSMEALTKKFLFETYKGRLMPPAFLTAYVNVQQKIRATNNRSNLYKNLVKVKSLLLEHTPHLVTQIESLGETNTTEAEDMDTIGLIHELLPFLNDAKVKPILDAMLKRVSTLESGNFIRQLIIHKIFTNGNPHQLRWWYRESLEDPDTDKELVISLIRLQPNFSRVTPQYHFLYKDLAKETGELIKKMLTDPFFNMSAVGLENTLKVFVKYQGSLGMTDAELLVTKFKILREIARSATRLETKNKAKDLLNEQLREHPDQLVTQIESLGETNTTEAEDKDTIGLIHELIPSLDDAQVKPILDAMLGRVIEYFRADEKHLDGYRLPLLLAIMGAVLIVLEKMAEANAEAVKIKWRQLSSDLRKKMVEEALKKVKKEREEEEEEKETAVRAKWAIHKHYEVVREEEKRAAAAAKIIQPRVRAHIAKKAAAAKIIAKIIQPRVRAHIARKSTKEYANQYERVKKRAVLAANIIRKAAKKATTAKKERISATTIQAARRGLLAKRQLERRVVATTTIQTARRGLLAKRQLLLLLRQLERRVVATTKIQAARRGLLKRIEFQKRRADATKIQAARRGMLERTKFPEKKQRKLEEKRGSLRKAFKNKIEHPQEGGIIDPITLNLMTCPVQFGGIRRTQASEEDEAKNLIGRQGSIHPLTREPIFGKELIFDKITFVKIVRYLTASGNKADVEIRKSVPDRLDRLRKVKRVAEENELTNFNPWENQEDGRLNIGELIEKAIKEVTEIEDEKDKARLKAILLRLI